MMFSGASGAEIDGCSSFYVLVSKPADAILEKEITARSVIA